MLISSKISISCPNAVIHHHRNICPLLFQGPQRNSYKRFRRWCFGYFTFLFLHLKWETYRHVTSKVPFCGASAIELRLPRLHELAFHLVMKAQWFCSGGASSHNRSTLSARPSLWLLSSSSTHVVHSIKSVADRITRRKGFPVHVGLSDAECQITLWSDIQWWFTILALIMFTLWWTNSHDSMQPIPYYPSSQELASILHYIQSKADFLTTFVHPPLWLYLRPTHRTQCVEHCNNKLCVANAREIMQMIVL
jgi:hypothetical protein